jgi:hypothetical protein
VLSDLFYVGGRIKLSNCWLLSRVGQLVGFVTDGPTVAHGLACLEHLRALQPLDNIRAALRFVVLVNAYSRNIPLSASAIMHRLQRFVSANQWPASGHPRRVHRVT